MRRLASLLALALMLAACDVKQRLREVDSTRINDSIRIADSTAAAAAEAARSAPKPPPPMALGVSGSQHFSRDSGFTVSCISSASGGETLLQIEGIGRGAHVNFTVYNARDGSVRVGNAVTRGRARVGNLQVFVGTRGYTDGRGRAELTDPFGRSGSLSASNFVKLGGRKGQSKYADLSVRVRWHCE